MKSLRFWDRRAGYSLASVGLLLGMIAPSVLPAFASAAQLTSRSMALSSSVVSDTGVTYDIKFTAPGSIDVGGGVGIEFCSDSPIVGQSCTHPTGLSASSATLTDVKVNGTTLGANKGSIAKTAATVTWTSVSSGTYSGGDSVEIVLANITNPSTANSALYARFTTYQAANISGFTGGATVGTYTDSGAVATSITNPILVQAAVKETMTFCVSGDVGGTGPTGNCGTDANGGSAVNVTSPSITLGHGTPAALDSSQIDTAADWAQISTNAVSGAIVSMKNTNSGNCSGLFRTGASSCEIAGAGGTAVTFANGDAKFGVRLSNTGDAPFSQATPTGTITPVAPYDGGSGTQYGMGSGVTGTYGDPIFNTTSAPIANKNVKLTFGAGAAPTTPAGIYRATVNLIATGTF
ncbi:MAG TPA: hypothetical protein VLG92_02385 [Candidatus Saccharimonadia bacterium]|nr:hypothetical protein [Candidatus Saccharimonadia bacterium]